MLIIPWPRTEDDHEHDLRKHGLAAILRNDMASGYDLDDVSYQVISNINSCHTADSLYDSIKTGIHTMSTSSGPSSKMSNPLGKGDFQHQPEGDAEPEADMIRQEVQQPHQLQGLDLRAQRRRESASAFGGM